MSTCHHLNDNSVKLSPAEPDRTVISCSCQHGKSAIKCFGSNLLNIVSAACLTLLFYATQKIRNKIQTMESDGHPAGPEGSS